ncbi:thiamine phosphate synthase [Robbsia andropogonis]|uniref:thiamine phosphate synthase n=1 Tax=Robbsia andropogonis TaxID=28092 RepID=UPI003D1DB1D3
MTLSAPLPRRYLITPEPAPDAPLLTFIDHLETALAGGITLVQLRAKTVTPAQYAWLAREARICCRRHGARLLLNAPPELARSLHADGVHLTSARLMHCASRPLPSDFLVSAACHDTHQVIHANTLGADLLTISPVLATKTHVDAEPLGWPRFREIAALTSIPVYALGGMRIASLDEALAAGAHGIAAIGDFWGEDVRS